MLRVITLTAFETSKKFKSIFNGNSLIHISLNSILWKFRLIEINYQVNIPYLTNSDRWKYTLILRGGGWVGIKQIIFKYTTTNVLPNVVRVTLRVSSPNRGKDSRRKHNWTFKKMQDNLLELYFQFTLINHISQVSKFKVRICSIELFSLLA